MDLFKLLDVIVESSLAEQEPSTDTPTIDVSRDNKNDSLVHLALSNVVHGPESLENDLVSLAQATKDSLKQFLAGKSDISSVDALSGKLRDASDKLNAAVDQVKAQVGNEPLPKDTVKQLRLTGNRFARLKPKTQARLMKQINIDGFHNEVATAAKPDKSGKNVAYHVASYSLTKPRMKNYRVSTDKDKSKGRGILHLFKKGRKYVGFAIVDKPTTNEDFNEIIETLLSEGPQEKIVLTYTSDNLSDVFNINNYKYELPNGAEVADHLNGKFGTQLRTLSSAAVSQIQKSALAQPVQQAPTPASTQASPSTAQAPTGQVPKALADLADKYENGSKLVEPAAKQAYKTVAEWLRVIKTQKDLDHYIKVINNGIKMTTDKIHDYEGEQNSSQVEKQKASLARLKNILADISKISIPQNP